MTLGLPNGAPSCGISEIAITNGMHTPSDKSLGYALQVVPAGGSNWDISISNSAGRSDYQGLLIYVHQLKSPSAHLGQFTFKNQTKWKYLPISLCESKKINSSTPMSTFTHANPDRVPMAGNVTFRWTASPSELAMNGLVVSAVVASSDDNLGNARWQRLNYFGIPPTGATSLTLSSPPTPSSTSASPAASTITIKVGPGGLFYDQPVVKANIGDTVVWNFVASQHTVTQSTDAKSCVPMSGGFDSGKKSAPGSFSQVLNATGSIYYMCTVGSHCAAGMKGQIIVRASKSNSSAPSNTLGDTLSTSNSSVTVGAGGSTTTPGPAAGNGTSAQASSGADSPFYSFSMAAGLTFLALLNFI